MVRRSPLTYVAVNPLAVLRPTVRHPRPAATLAADEFEHLDGLDAAHAIIGQPRVPLEVLECAHCCRAHDPVRTTTVEAEVIEVLLQGRDVARLDAVAAAWTGSVHEVPGTRPSRNGNRSGSNSEPP